MGKASRHWINPNYSPAFPCDDDLAYENRGQGLGLAIVKSIADKHGGNVSVKSTLGEGSTFYLDLPLHKIEPKIT